MKKWLNRMGVSPRLGCLIEYRIVPFFGLTLLPGAA